MFVKASEGVTNSFYEDGVYGWSFKNGGSGPILLHGNVLSLITERFNEDTSALASMQKPQSCYMFSKIADATGSVFLPAVPNPYAAYYLMFAGISLYENAKFKIIADSSLKNMSLLSLGFSEKQLEKVSLEFI